MQQNFWSFLNMHKCLLVGGGAFPSLELLEQALMDVDTIIAVDRGYDLLQKAKVIPDYLVGDLDSIRTSYDIDSRTTKIERYNPDKSMTDLDIAIEKSIEIGAEEVVLIACTGNRMDHTLMNLFLLNKYMDNGIRANIVDDNNDICMISGELKLSSGGYKYFSIIPLSDETEVTIKDGKYELDKRIIRFAESMPISNEFLSDSAYIKVNKKSFVVRSRD